MNYYLILYDLCEERNYSKLYNRLEKFERAERINKSVWKIWTSFTLEEVKYAILCAVDTDDKIIIIAQDWKNTNLGYNNFEAKKLKSII